MQTCIHVNVNVRFHLIKTCPFFENIILKVSYHYNTFQFKRLFSTSHINGMILLQEVHTILTYINVYMPNNVKEGRYVKFIIMKLSGHIRYMYILFKHIYKYTSQTTWNREGKHIFSFRHYCMFKDNK